ncbi:hypothetical protein M427DRAFT_334569 [Gonapodya prolifera JEL478]|uniref:Uncharacterized protein n=1 Tax=Gonapodya prolifera (strain JEL478) TaxID=1344416 RepID=A0A139AEE1_GONPJ|nr:hypothetical protein M427DRAFT_334569 [Gonapodya prolifera JEL478]|eukprot:KXS14793.1 hypothetical protein M427DRAFT_334569 [Gonapodya prolifera JEL478]
MPSPAKNYTALLNSAPHHYTMRYSSPSPSPSASASLAAGSPPKSPPSHSHVGSATSLDSLPLKNPHGHAHSHSLAIITQISDTLPVTASAATAAPMAAPTPTKRPTSPITTTPTTPHPPSRPRSAAALLAARSSSSSVPKVSSPLRRSSTRATSSSDAYADMQDDVRPTVLRTRSESAASTGQAHRTSSESCTSNDSSVDEGVLVVARSKARREGDAADGPGAGAAAGAVNGGYGHNPNHCTANGMKETTQKMAEGGRPPTEASLPPPSAIPSLPSSPTSHLPTSSSSSTTKSPAQPHLHQHHQHHDQQQQQQQVPTLAAPRPTRPARLGAHAAAPPPPTGEQQQQGQHRTLTRSPVASESAENFPALSLPTLTAPASTNGGGGAPIDPSRFAAALSALTSTTTSTSTRGSDQDPNNALAVFAALSRRDPRVAAALVEELGRQVAAQQAAAAAAGAASGQSGLGAQQGPGRSPANGAEAGATTARPRRPPTRPTPTSAQLPPPFLAHLDRLTASTAAWHHPHMRSLARLKRSPVHRSVLWSHMTPDERVESVLEHPEKGVVVTPGGRRSKAVEEMRGVLGRDERARKDVGGEVGKGGDGDREDEGEDQDQAQAQASWLWKWLEGATRHSRATAAGGDGRAEPRTRGRSASLPLPPPRRSSPSPAPAAPGTTHPAGPPRTLTRAPTASSPTRALTPRTPPALRSYVRVPGTPLVLGGSLPPGSWRTPRDGVGPGVARGPVPVFRAGSGFERFPSESTVGVWYGFGGKAGSVVGPVSQEVAGAGVGAVAGAGTKGGDAAGAPIAQKEGGKDDERGKGWAEWVWGRQGGAGR